MQLPLQDWREPKQTVLFFEVAFVRYLAATARKVAINLYPWDTKGSPDDTFVKSLPGRVGGRCSVFTGKLHGAMWNERNDLAKRFSSPVSLRPQLTCFYFIFHFLRQGSRYLRLKSTFLCSREWPRTPDLASTSGVLGLQVCIIKLAYAVLVFGLRSSRLTDKHFTILATSSAYSPMEFSSWGKFRSTRLSPWDG